MSGIKLYNAWYSPFGQRVWIALLEKKVNFQYMEIDPTIKTEEFMKINPRGMIPVLNNNGQCVYESTICMEYIEEQWKGQGQALMPSDPFGRATVRIWSDFINKKIVPNFYQLFLRQAKEEQDEFRKTLLTNLEVVSKAMSSDGPYFMGAEFGMVDITLLPYTLRFVALKHYRNFELPDAPSFAKLKKWMDIVHVRDNVKATHATDEKLIMNYEEYANNTAKSGVAESMRQGKALP